MRNKDLLTKRVYPAIKEMYTKSETVFPKEELPSDFEFTFENLTKYAPFMKMENDKSLSAALGVQKPMRQFPIDFFYLPFEENDAIIKKATKNLRYYYIFPYRSEIIYSDDEIEQMKARVEKLKAEYGESSFEIDMLTEKIEHNDEYRRRDNLWKSYCAETKEITEKYHNNEITLKEFNASMKPFYKKYGCIRRSRDAEAVSWELFNYGPNTHKPFFEALKAAYNGEEFEYHNRERILEAAELAHAFVNNIKNNTPTDDKDNQ